MNTKNYENNIKFVNDNVQKILGMSKEEIDDLENSPVFEDILTTLESIRQKLRSKCHEKD